MIEKGNLRNRRRQSREMIHTRLMILDFIIAHPDEAYLETEADKIHYFTRGLGIPLTTLPARIYHGIKSVSEHPPLLCRPFSHLHPRPGQRFRTSSHCYFHLLRHPRNELFATSPTSELPTVLSPHRFQPDFCLPRPP